MFELPLSVSFEVSATSELSEAASLCTSSPDDGSEEPSLDKGADESTFDETVEELPLDDVEEELSSDVVEEELSSDDVNEELSSDVVEEELSPDELFALLDVFEPSYFSVRVSSVPHTEQVLFSRPSLLAVGAFAVTHLPNECLFVFGVVVVFVSPQTVHFSTVLPPSLQVAAVVEAVLYECLFVFGIVFVLVSPQTVHVSVILPSDLQVAAVVVVLYEC